MASGKKLIVMPGDKYFRLTIIKETEKRKGRRYFLCRCECGVEKEIRLEGLSNGQVVSCGCFNREISSTVNKKHGMYRSRIYRIWAGMRSRCLDVNKDCYNNYGGRGITICPEWSDFITFYNWAMANGYKDNLSIDRINVNGNYEPANCSWITLTAQKKNTRISKKIVFNGETKTLREWANAIGVSSSTLCRRLKSMSVGEALSAKAAK